MIDEEDTKKNNGNAKNIKSIPEWIETWRRAFERHGIKLRRYEGFSLPDGSTRFVIEVGDCASTLQRESVAVLFLLDAPRASQAAGKTRSLIGRWRSEQGGFKI